MKKSILILVLLMICSIVLASCDNGSSGGGSYGGSSGGGSYGGSSGGGYFAPSCDHVLASDAEIVKDADCVEKGILGGTCTICGEYGTQTFEAYGHNMVDGYCTVCGETEEQNEE